MGMTKFLMIGSLHCVLSSTFQHSWLGMMLPSASVVMRPPLK